MPPDLIGAEVVPRSEKAVEAAKALQKLGFKVLHAGGTSVSVQGPQSLWQEHFRVTFETRSKQQHPFKKGGATSYQRPVEDPVPIPSELSELISAVAFVEPPEFF